MRNANRHTTQRKARYARAMVVACLIAGIPALAPVAADSLTAQQIADRVVRSDTSNWVGTRTRVRMTLSEGNVTKQERSMEFVGRKKDGKYQGRLTFLTPADVAGTTFLMLESGPNQAEQYIYTPALKRTRRIAGRERDGAFMGSDFTYADMQGIDKKDAAHQRLSDENIGNEPCYVLETTINPNAKAGYGKVVSWIRKTDYVALRTKFFDRAGKHIKTLYTRRVKQVDGGPVITEARMQTEATAHATEIFVDSIERKDDLPDGEFTPAALEHR